MGRLKLITYISAINFAIVIVLVVGVLAYSLGIYSILTYNISILTNWTYIYFGEIRHELIISALVAMIFAVCGLFLKKLGRWPFKRGK